jgi:hypothetical protein
MRTLAPSNNTKARVAGWMQNSMGIRRWGCRGTVCWPFFALSPILESFKPEIMSDAWKQVEEWLDCELAWIPEPTERHREVLGSLLAGSGMQANLVPDAHLASLAIQHGLILCSTGGDFARFRNLRCQNPLSA